MATNRLPIECSIYGTAGTDKLDERVCEYCLTWIWIAIYFNCLQINSEYDWVQNILNWMSFCPSVICQSILRLIYGFYKSHEWHIVYWHSDINQSAEYRHKWIFGEIPCRCILMVFKPVRINVDTTKAVFDTFTYYIII